MQGPDFYLPANPAVLFVAHQAPPEQSRQREAAQRFTRNAVRTAERFAYLNPATTYSATDLGERLAKDNPAILNLWLPEAEAPGKKSASGSSGFEPSIYPDELSKIIQAAGRDLIILTIQNGFSWGFHDELAFYLAPCVVFSIAPVPDRLWGDLLDTWYRVLDAGVPVQAAFDKALEGISADFPEAQELMRMVVNPEFAAERGYQEPQKAAEEEKSGAGKVGEGAEEEGNISHQEANPEQSQDAGTTTESSSLASIAGGAHSDHPTDDEEKDWLGYKSYAQIIARIIQDPKSEPPLSIAVIGPWGQGKSSLMRMIQRRVGEKGNGNPSGTDQAADYEQIKEWTEKDSPDNQDWQKLRHPTVWFNPWEYQSSEQLWAGMAHAIIHQLVGKLPKLQQEHFWLALHLERVDKQAIRQRIYRDVLIRALPWLLMLAMVIILGTILIVTGNLGWALGVAGLGGIPSLFQSIRTWVKNWQEGFKNVYEEFLKPPDYGKNLGIYHEVSEDLERVFRLLVDQPAVIFIDDLDRCSPQKVVEVIEAINLIMNARFREKCYFVIGMDAEMVAAALDVSYQGMKGKFPGKEKTLGSVGWYFLDKFIQVPVVLPTMSEDDKALFLKKLFAKPSPSPTRTDPRGADAPEIKAAARDILQGVKTKDTSTIEQTREETRSRGTEEELDEAILEQAYDATEDADDIQQQVKEFAPYLDPSPRSIKRFANLLRFYTAQQQLRETKSLEAADTAALAKWLIITLRWPMLVRWLQWREDQGIFHPLQKDVEGHPQLILRSNIPADKARVLDELFMEGPIGIPDDFFWQNLATANEHLPWMADKDLVRILTEKNRPGDQLARAFVCDVW